MRRWPSSQVDFRGLFDNGDLLLWSTASLSTTSALLYKKQNGASSRLLRFLPVSLVVIHFSVISSPQHTPPSSFCLPFRQEISLTRLLFFSLYDTASCSLLLCQSVSCAQSRSPSFFFSLRPNINTGGDFSLRVCNMFLQLYQERCVNGRVAGRLGGWVAGLGCFSDKEMSN